jgi:putative addiction module component (TIGR02574 family)
MTAQAIKEEIVQLTRQQQAEIVHFIMDILVEEEDFELTDELKTEIDASYDAIENGVDKGFSHEAYRTEIDQLLAQIK